MGSDFQYANAHLWYKNLDKLIKYINDNKDTYNATVLYSTPEEFLEKLHD